MSPWVAVGKDVGRVEKIGVPQLAYRALGPVGLQHSGPKHRLVKTLAGQPLHVGTTKSCRLAWTFRADESLGLIHGYDELVRGHVLADDEDGELGVVHPCCDPDEVGKRELPQHGLAQRPVVGVLRVETPVLVTDESVIAQRVFVRRQLARVCERRADRQRRVQEVRLADPRLHDEPYLHPIDLETVDVRGTQAVRVTVCQAVEVGEHRGAYPLFDLAGDHRMISTSADAGWEAAATRRTQTRENADGWTA